MKKILYFVLITFGFQACQAQEVSEKDTNNTMKKYNSLTEQEQYVILQKGTDYPFTGSYYTKKDEGVYICKQCNNPLYRSDDKFDSHCGWPSFDDEIDGAVIRTPDKDGQRTEIICANCKGHLGHVFLNEGFTDKETRHCVNTSSLQFYAKEDFDKIPAVIR